MCRMSLLSAALSAAIALVQVQAEQQNQQTAPGGQPAATAVAPAPSTPAPGNNDRPLAHCLIVENRGEVEIAQFAQQKSQNEEVKQFAQRMIDDHTKMLASLEKFGGAQVPSAPAAPAIPATQPATTAVPGATGDLPGAAKGTLDFAALKEELGRQCVASSKADLDQKQGAEFDKCYVGMAIGAHKHAIDAITVFRNHASPEFRKTLDEALPVVQAHKDHAVSLKKKLEGATAPQAAGRPTDQPVR